jgi:phosphoadenosine phosphosulfate reductase
MSDPTMKESLEALRIQAESWKPEEVLSWAFATFGDNVAIATGLGVEGMALLDIAVKVNPDVKVFTGDTEFLFSETYDLIDRVEKRYAIKIERIFSELTPEEQERKYGAALWTRNPDQCCTLRKVEPLRKKLATLDAWVTAIRRDQTAQRAQSHKIEWDDRFHLVKVNPLVDWTSQMVWSYVQKNKVPYNELHDRSFPSIGCMHCTQPVMPGEDPRAGRWAGFQKKECGLHLGNAPVPAPLVQLEAPVNYED